MANGFDDPSVERDEGDPRPQARGPNLTEVELTDLARRFADEIESQEDARANQLERWRRYLELYRGEPATQEREFPWRGASNLVVTIAATMVDSTAARIMGAIFGSEPLWVGEQVNKQFAPAIKPVERYLDFARTRVWNQWSVVNDFTLETCKLGTGVIFNGWQDREFFRFDERTGQTISAGTQRGPHPRWVPREDFMIPQGFSDIQDAPYVSARQWFSWGELERLAHQGFLERIDEIRKKPDEQTDMRMERRKQTAGDDSAIVRPSSGSDEDNDFALYALDNVWFRLDLDDDGWPEEYVMVLHRQSRTVLRVRANPYFIGTRPFIHAPFVRQEGEFDGIGIPQMLEHYQDEISTTVNQQRDAAHLRNAPMFAGRRGSGLTEKTRWWPGRIMLMTDPKSDLVPLQVGGQGFEAAQQVQLTLGLAKERVGLSDINQGQMSSPLGRAAATTVLSLLQEGATRREFTTTGIRQALAEQGLQILELYQTHGLPDPSAPASPELVLAGDEQAAQAVRALVEVEDNIRGLIGLKLNVATAAVNREVEKQSTMQLFGVARQYLQDTLGVAPLVMNPNVPQPLKEAIVGAITNGLDPLMRRVFQAFSVYDLDSVLIGELLQGLVQQAPQPGMGMGAPGGEQAPPEGGNGQMPPGPTGIL